MGVPYDLFTEAFLDKVTSYEFPEDEFARTGFVDRLMKRAIAKFQSICKYDFSTTADDNVREFNVEIEPGDLDELIEIISDGMVVQWIKPYLNRAENLSNMLNTRDFTAYSPANLLTSVRSAYDEARKRYEFDMRNYSYIHGDLSDLHL